MRGLIAIILVAVGVACAQNPMPGWMAPSAGGDSGCDAACQAAIGDTAAVLRSYADSVGSGSGSGIPAWSSDTAYSQNAPVIWTSYVCFSSVPGTGTNTGHTPAAPPGNSYWGCYSNIGSVIQFIFNNAFSQ